ncbi:TlpA family protein disulfide reductase [Hymenobacter sp. RP-2-7]|uniref:TlpA family protein disulfide reductase n=1 Tax=Hymenobacter polaris TaxID=2682546 RepID=A0A7Y0AG64_9BACT|nr:TlpA disulfide reductase family protein [Hymenobacter polaris]NML66741.1 TlpA family protein disulfide reductase [Hymenobacter polaris]
MLNWLRSNWRDVTFLAGLAVVFGTDLRLPVVSTLQRGLLATGFWQPALPTRPALGPAAQLVSERTAGLPSVALYTLGGQPANLRQFAGKVVLVNMWASWCPPCLAEMPGLQALYQQVDTAKIAFVCISLDANPNRARALLKHKGYTLPVFFPAAPLPAPFASSSIPYTVILAPDGRVAASHAGMADYDTPAFRQALEQLAK